MANEKRLIDANALIAYFEEQYNVAMDDPDPVSGYVMSALRCCIEHFKTIPTVDAVEVVRCKDCKYFKPAHFKADDGTETPWDETFSFDYRSDGIHYGARCKHERNTAYGLKDMAFRKADDFCSYGERKDNETD